jgi:hypothetical protein
MSKSAIPKPESSCGAPADEAEPIVCTLEGRDMQTRVDEYRAVFGRIVGAERFDHGFAWRFRWDPEVEVQVRALVAKEKECCRFFRFDVRHEGADIVWETRAEPRAAAVLEEFFCLPERLRHEPERSGTMPMTAPIACAPLSADDLQRHIENARTLFAAVQEVRPLAEGWALRLADAPDVLERLATFVALNRRCCTHLRHTVAAEAFHGPIWLELYGGGESGRAALAGELEGLLPAGTMPDVPRSGYPEWLAEIDAIARRELGLSVAQMFPRLAPTVSPFAECVDKTTPADFVDRHLRPLAGAQ